MVYHVKDYIVTGILYITCTEMTSRIQFYNHTNLKAIFFKTTDVINLALLLN